MSEEWTGRCSAASVLSLNSKNENVSICIAIFWCLESSRAPRSPWAGGPLLTKVRISRYCNDFLGGYYENYPDYVNFTKKPFQVPGYLYKPQITKMVSLLILCTSYNGWHFPFSTTVEDIGRICGSTSTDLKYHATCICELDRFLVLI